MTTARSTGSAARWRAGVVVLGIGMLALSACGADSATTSASSSAAGAADTGAGQGFAAPPIGGVAATSAASSSAAAGGSDVAAAGEAAAGVAETGAPAAVPVTALDNRQIIRTADLQIRLAVPADTPDDQLGDVQDATLDAAVNKARSQVIGVGGFVADLQQAGGSASMVLRVPAAGYDTFRTGALEWGQITSSTEAAQDVTDEYTDVESRITSMRTSVDRIRALLAQATAVPDVIVIESELARREADLDSLEGRRQVLADQVSLGTVTVTLAAVRDAAPEVAVVAAEEERGGFLGGLAAGWTGLVTFLSGVGVVLGAVLPFVPLILVLVLAGWWARRAVRRRRPVTPPRPRTPAPDPA